MYTSFWNGDTINYAKKYYYTKKIIPGYTKPTYKETI